MINIYLKNSFEFDEKYRNLGLRNIVVYFLMASLEIFLPECEDNKRCDLTVLMDGDLEKCLV